jgi:RHS repeat-associated protein
MAGMKSGFRIAAVVTLAVGGWFACSSVERPEADVGPIATTHEALNPGPGGTPTPVAWYVAAPNNLTYDQTTLAVSGWTDISGNSNNVIQNFDPGRPHLNPTGWAGHQPTLTFDGGDLLRLDTWSAGTPAGVNTPLTVVAVMRPAAAVQAEVAAWWDPNGGGSAWAGINVADGRTVPDFGRTYVLSATQTYNGPHDLGTGPHIVAWRYTPSSQTMSISVDGTTSPPSSSMAPIGELPQMGFIIGAGSTLANRLFQGDISELIVFADSLTDSELANVNTYLRSEWDGLPTQGSTDACTDASGQATPVTTRCDDGDSSTYGDHCSNRTCAGTVPPAGNPAQLSARAWYHAGAPEVYVRDGVIETWFDRTGNHLDLSQGHYPARPSLLSDGWSSGKPTLSFDGHRLLFRNAWTDVPDGTDSEFTVLAVLQPAGAQNTGMASWWSGVGAGSIAADLKANGSATSLDLFRTDDTHNQDFSSSTDLGTSKHVLAWRYSPEHISLSIDGTSASPTGTLPTLNALNPELFLAGADSAFASSLLNANLAELALIPRSITDTELTNFDSYAQAEWGGLPVCSPSCSGCGVSDGCGGTCACGGACASNVQCTAGLVCTSGQCEPPTSSIGGICTTDADCPSGVHCSSGICGGDGAVCGVCASGLTCTDGACACIPNCDGKTCGADDGCGNACPQACGAGQIGCTTDVDCPVGYACGIGVGAQLGLAPGANVCWPFKCREMDPHLPGCGVGNDPSCGTCPVCSPVCDDKQCGSDGCGGQCGTCAEGTTCSPTGSCISSFARDEFATSGHFSGFPAPLAEADTAPVGAIPGSISVGDRGAANYTIPIAVPPARAGFAPQLALAYTGDKHDGIMGPGWRVTGLSAVSRCALPNRPVTYHQIEFCLNGAHLVKVSEDPGDGTLEFRTEVDGFSKIIGHGFVASDTDPTRVDGPDYFEVFTKDGRRLTYGKDSSLNPTLTKDGATRVWSIDSARDRAGNTILYKYLPHTETLTAPGTADTGELVPDEITYNGSDAGFQGDAWIDFQYEDRPDPVYQYVDGALGFSLQRLSKVTTFVGGTAVLTYQIGYDTDSSVSKVTSVTLCTETGGPDKPCIPATSFSYNPVAKYAWTDTNLLAGTAFNSVLGTMDQDGDGLSDVILRRPPVNQSGGDQYLVIRTRIAPDGTVTGDQLPLDFPIASPPLILDINGDGRDDIIDPDGGRILVSGLESLTPISFDLPPVFTTPPELGSRTITARTVADLDGNGRGDYVMAEPYRLTFYVSQNGTFAPAVSFAPPDVPTVCKDLLPVDVDGDRADEVLCVPSDASEVVALGITTSDAGQSLKSIPTGIKPRSSASELIVMDFNGDGLKDVLEETPSPIELILWLNTGQGFQPSSLAVGGDGDLQSMPALHLAHVFDVDGDQRDDLVFADPNGGRVMIYQSTGLYTLTRSVGPSTSDKIGVGDFNGDGSLDLIGINGAADSTPFFEVDVAVIGYGSNGANGLLSTVTDGAGKKDTLQYNGNTALSSGLLWTFTPGNGVPPGTSSVSHVPPLVSELVELDTNSGQRGRRLVYAYDTALVGVQGEGFFGFGGKEVRLLDDLDQVVNMTRTDFYNADKVRAGLPATVTETSASVTGSFVSQPVQYTTIRETAIEVAISASGEPFPKVTGGSDIYLETGDIQPTSPVRSRTWTADVNDFGDAEHVTITEMGPGFAPNVTFETTTVDTTYWPNDETNWQISLAQDVTTTNTRGSDTETRTVRYDYYSNGLLQDVIRQKDDPELYLQTHFGRDNPYWNVDSVVRSSSSDSTLGLDVRREDIGYDDRNTFPLTITNAESQTRELDIDPATGSTRILSDPNRIFTMWAYDGFGRLKEIVGPNGSTTFDYATAGATDSTVIGAVAAALQVTETPPGGGTEVRSTDGFGRLVSIDKVGFQGTHIDREFAYNWRHQLVQETLPHAAGDASQGISTTTYDVIGRLSSVVAPDGSTTNYGYASRNSVTPALDSWLSGSGNDDALYLRAVMLPRGNLKAQVLDHNGAPVGSTEAEAVTSDALASAHVSTMDYGAFGTLSHVYDQLGNVTTVVPDPLGRITDLYDPDKGHENRVYSPWGEIVQSTDGNDETRVFHYDSLARLREILDSNQKIIAKWVFDGPASRNEVGRLLSVYRQSQPGSATGNTLRYQYYEATGGTDNSGRLFEIDRDIQGADGATHTLSTQLSYDPVGRIDTILYPSAPGEHAGDPAVSFGVQHTYDHDGGMLISVADKTTNAPFWQMINADQGFRLSYEQFGNGVVSSLKYYSLGDESPACTTSGSYSCVPGALHTISRGPTTPAAQITQQFEYAYDRNGNLSTRTTPNGGQENLVYDGFDQLTEHTQSYPSGLETLESYSYDPLGNITFRTGVGSYTYGGLGPHAVSSIGASNNYIYDGNGNQVTRTGDLVQDAPQTLYYNDFQMPWRITTGFGVDKKTTDFEYDGFGHRIAKHGPANDTLYAGDLYEQVIASDNIEHRYKIYAGGRQVAQVTKTEVRGVVTQTSTQYVQDDHLGSATTITDESGAVVESRVYGPFGDTSSDLSSSAVHAGFTGHEHDPELGLINMRGRLYDPGIGRFVQADPFGSISPRGANRYGYVMNNPLSATDPTGYWWHVIDSFIPSHPGSSQGSSDAFDAAAEDTNPVVEVGLDLSDIGGYENYETPGAGGDQGANAGKTPDVCSGCPLPDWTYGPDGPGQTPGVDNGRPDPVPGASGPPSGGPGTDAGSVSGGEGAGSGPDPGGSASLGQSVPSVGVTGPLSLARGGYRQSAGGFNDGGTGQGSLGTGAPAQLGTAVPDALALAIATQLGLTAAGAGVGWFLGEGVLTEGIVSASDVEAHLLANGYSAEEAAAFADSFEGPITARMTETGEQFVRYSKTAGTRGNFLTDTVFESPDAAMDALNLRPFGNTAGVRQMVFANSPSMVFEGQVADGTAAQTLVVDKGAFTFGLGVVF